MANRRRKLISRRFEDLLFAKEVKLSRHELFDFIKNLDDFKFEHTTYSSFIKLIKNEVFDIIEAIQDDNQFLDNYFKNHVFEIIEEEYNYLLSQKSEKRYIYLLNDDDKQIIYEYYFADTNLDEIKEDFNKLIQYKESLFKYKRKKKT